MHTQKRKFKGRECQVDGRCQESEPASRGQASLSISSFSREGPSQGSPPEHFCLWEAVAGLQKVSLQGSLQSPLSLNVRVPTVTEPGLVVPGRHTACNFLEGVRAGHSSSQTILPYFLLQWPASWSALHILLEVKRLTGEGSSGPHV